MSDNPYAPGLYSDQLLHESPEGDELANRFTRFASALVDGILVLGVVGPIQFLSGYQSRVAEGGVGIVEQLVMTLLGVIVWLAIHGYLLLTRGQSVGKLLTGIQVVSFKEGKLLPFVRVYVFRYLWYLPLSLLGILIPGPFDDGVIGLLLLINPLMIFLPEKRCLHDYIAGSKVVKFKPGRDWVTTE